MNFELWRSADRARELGCTHRARMFGLVPGFFSEQGNLWVSRSDLLAIVESFLAFNWVLIRVLRGEEPDFMFEILDKI